MMGKKSSILGKLGADMRKWLIALVVLMLVSVPISEFYSFVTIELSSMILGEIGQAKSTRRYCNYICIFDFIIPTIAVVAQFIRIKEFTEQFSGILYDVLYW